MNNRYAVLNDKLLPPDVAELLLLEGAGESVVSVEIDIKIDGFSEYEKLESLLSDARRTGLIHSWSVASIYEMLEKLIRNNGLDCNSLKVKLVQGKNSFLYAYCKSR